MRVKEPPESLLKKLPLNAMFQLNTALAKEKKTSERLGVNTRLAHNAKKMVRHPVEVEKGVNNRREKERKNPQSVREEEICEAVLAHSGRHS